jgi:hypothetical protein
MHSVASGSNTTVTTALLTVDYSINQLPKFKLQFR